MTSSAETWVLVVHLFINGVWVHGDTLDGWSAIQQPDQQTCQRKAEAANAINDQSKYRFSCNRRQEYDRTRQT